MCGQGKGSKPKQSIKDRLDMEEEMKKKKREEKNAKRRLRRAELKAKKDENKCKKPTCSDLTYEEVSFHSYFSSHTVLCP